jgi:3-hydroxymyristoyl/3-hydroxydecanoyl-(acyl carrier protein) dehydratase
MMKVLRGVGIYNARVLVDNNVAAIAEITVAKKEV